jgi:hypothetical protein
VLRDHKTLFEADVCRIPYIFGLECSRPSQLKLLSYEKIAENPHYTVLFDHCATLEAAHKEDREQITRLSDEVGNLRASRQEWEDGITVRLPYHGRQGPILTFPQLAAAQASQEFKGMIAKRDAENARLREQREQQAAELNERKHKESVKLASLQELKALTESRSVSGLHLDQAAVINVHKIGTYSGVGVRTSPTQGSACCQCRQ